MLKLIFSKHDTLKYTKHAVKPFVAQLEVLSVAWTNDQNVSHLAKTALRERSPPRAYFMTCPLIPSRKPAWSSSPVSRACAIDRTNGVPRALHPYPLFLTTYQQFPMYNAQFTTGPELYLIQVKISKPCNFFVFNGRLVWSAGGLHCRICWRPCSWQVPMIEPR